MPYGTTLILFFYEIRKDMKQKENQIFFMLKLVWKSKLLKFMMLFIFAVIVNVTQVLAVNTYSQETLLTLTLNETSIKNVEIQPTKSVSGNVTDNSNQPLPFVTVVIKGTTTGFITDSKGNYFLPNVKESDVLVFSFVGMSTQEIPVSGMSVINVKMLETTVDIEDVVVIGYGTQKKESVVGSITTAKAEVLERRGGVSNLGNALSGQLPGVTVMSTTDEPGKEDPKILIRGLSTWNNSSPLILVDGIERRMNDIDVNEVASISVLKDASATAVFGVKGANGVILITTKRGEIGKAKLSVKASNTFKYLSKASKLSEAYTSLLWKNQGIENEVSVNEPSWGNYMPYDEVLNYKTPQEYPYLYPNIDWQDLMLKKFATSQKVSMDVSGGTKFVSYFASIGYSHDGDILNSGFNEKKGYDPSFTYDRINFRGNLDFQVTSTTKLSVNLSGYTGQKKESNVASFNASWNDRIMGSIFGLAPNSFIPQYEDGMYGNDPTSMVYNPLAILNETGVSQWNNMFIGSDFTLSQNLDFITNGLSVQGRVSFDNTFYSVGPTLQDGQAGGMYLQKYVSPSIRYALTAADSANAIVYTELGGATSAHVNDYDWAARPWIYTPEMATTGSLGRALFYQTSLNYARSFGNHDVSGLFLFSRRKNASGGGFPSYQEDWVSRLTYDYRKKYFLEVNGAYNGSEKFGPGYRFGFFPSLAAGWMVSNENFMDYDWLDKLKVRGSIGIVGTDAGIPRWGYQNSWVVGSGTSFYGTKEQAYFNNDNGYFYVWNTKDLYSPYRSYHEGTIANPDINWESVLKKNIGVEVSVLKNKLSLDLDLFKDERSNVFMSASQRKIPVYFGAPPVAANLGKTETKGFELGIMHRNNFNNGFGYSLRVDVTMVNDMIIKAEDPILMDSYMKLAGYSIGQTKTQIHTDIGSSWDDVYAQTTISNTRFKLPGDWDIIDFNGDGEITLSDNIPYGYASDRPKKTYSALLGLTYKNLSFMAQLYGVTNITNYVQISTPGLARMAPLSAYVSDAWSVENPNASFKAPRVGTSSPMGARNYYDGSYLRLKTIEIAYLIPSSVVSRIGLSDLKVFINGNNLFYWSKMPVDVESGSVVANANAYPKLGYVNIGVNLNF